MSGVTQKHSKNKFNDPDNYRSMLSSCLFPSVILDRKDWKNFRAEIDLRLLGSLSFLKASATNKVYFKPLPLQKKLDDFYYLHLQVRGTTLFDHPYGTSKLEENSLFLANRKNIIRSGQLGSSEAIIVKLPISFLMECDRVDLDKYCWHPIPSDDASALFLKHLITDIYRSHNAFSSFEISKLSNTLLDLVEAAFCSVATKDFQYNCNDKITLKRIMQTINANIQSPSLNIDFIADSLYISKSKLFRIAKNNGVSIEQEIINSRLDWSANMLSNPEYNKFSITDIALEAGFCDQSHFSKCFKRRFSITPRQYKNRKFIS